MSDPLDPFNLQRFVDAQAHSYDLALTELLNGEKHHHWIWFVLPQIQGLGHSDMARRYALTGAAEADAYWHHPVLGPRLQACMRALEGHRGLSARDILGTPDDLKLRSCLTLFAQVVPPPSIFERLLERYFSADPDPRTLFALGDGTA